MREFCEDDFLIYMVGAEGSYETVTLSQLLPYSFSAKQHMCEKE
jgi:cytidine deaminase